MSVEKTALAGVKGLLFDKDGTLYDYDKMWGGWCRSVVARLAPGDEDLQSRLLRVAGFDAETSQFEVGSAFVNGTSDDTVEAFLSVAPHLSKATIEEVGLDELSRVPIPEICDLRKFTSDLLLRGLKLGVATNDFEQGANRQLRLSGIEAAFEFIAGYDSGHGAKPGPGQIHAFCSQTGLSPRHVGMVGDSTHDLHAARAAGCVAVAVLSGPAGRADLEDHADVILNDISELPAFFEV